MLLSALAPPQLEHTIETLHAEQEQPGPDPALEIIADCDRKLANYRALVEAGTDPAIVTEWIKDVTARRVVAEAGRRRPAAPTLTKPQIRDLIMNVDHLRQALRRADSAADKAVLYQSLRLRLTYQPQQNSVRAEAELGPDAVSIECVSEGGLDHRFVAPLRITGVHVKTVPRFNVAYERRADQGSDRAESESPQWGPEPSSMLIIPVPSV
jgi:site-specific DNA recombinase